jgi:hypothetical protein
LEFGNEECHILWKQELVDIFINKGARSWDEGMCTAAYKGFKDLIDLFISKGAKDWEKGMVWAEYGKHDDIIDFFKEKIEESKD